MKLLTPALCLALIACSSSSGMGDNTAAIPDNETAQPLTPGKRAVRIGEGGPGFAACGTAGQIINLAPTGETYLPVRASPFNEADEVDRLSEGQRVFTCSRSLDQRWQGVVVPPADAPDTDCGVSAPVARARDYAGPCKSGWIASAFVQLVAG